MNGQRIIKLLEIAGRSTTNDNEALNAVRKVANSLDTQGFTWSDLPTILGVDSSLLSRPTQDPNQQKRIVDLQDALSAAQARIAHLEANPLIKTVTKTVTKTVQDPKLSSRVDELEQLVRLGDASVSVLREELRVSKQGANSNASSPSGVPWSVFSKLAQKLLGQDWKLHGQRFGASAAMISRWERYDSVPIEFLDKLSRTGPVTIERKAIRR